VLDVERRVVEALIPGDDRAHLERVVAWVDGSLADMPELLRIGVLAESLAFAAWTRIRPARPVAELLEGLERSPIGLVRQYPRLFRSLVLFGDLELTSPDPG
jgi:hypothetical protein